MRGGGVRVWKAGLAFILLLAVLCRLAPLFLSSFPDPDDYFHLRMASLFYSQGSVPSWDPLSYGGRPYTYYPLFHATIAAAARLFSTTPFVAYALVGLLAGVLAVLAVFVLAQKACGSPWLKRELGPFCYWVPYFAALWVAVTPGAIARTSAFGRPDAFALAAASSAVLLLLEWDGLRGWWRFAAAFLLFLALSLMHLPTALVVAGLLVVVQACRLAAGTGGRHLSAGFFAAAGLGIFASWLLYYCRLPLSNYLSPASLASSELVPFAFPTILFYGSLALVFAFAGACWLWARGGLREYAWLAGWLLAAFVLVLAGSRNLVFLLPPAAIMAGVGLAAAARLAGRFSGAFLAYCMLACALLLAVFLFGLQGQYSPADLAAARGLSGPQAAPAGMVASLWDRGHMLAFESGRPVFVDGYFEYSSQALQRIGLTDACLSGNPAALPVCRGLGVKALFADGSMEAATGGGLAAYASAPAVQVARVEDSGAAAYLLTGPTS